MKVSIIILNWNRKKDTIECVESVSKLQILDCEVEVIVVDNNSKDGSQEAVEKIFKKLGNKKNLYYKQIKNKENLAFAAGNNVGMRYALESGADYILVLNNDTEVEGELVNKLLVVAKKYPKAGAISPKIYFAKGFEFQKRYKEADLGKVFWYAGGDIDWDNIYGTNHGVDEVDKGQFDKTEDTDFATGACVFYRSKALREVGLFNEKYFMYLEDAELSQRLRDRGWRVLYTPETKIWHKVAQSSAIGGELNDYFITRNRLLFGMRYAKLRTKLALIRESFRLLFKGRKWQRIGVRDFYLTRLGRGSWK